MKREEFIAQTAARWGFAERGDEKGTADTILQAVKLADALEKRNLAPWLIPTEQRELIDDIPKIVKTLMAETGISLPGAAPYEPPVVSVALINVASPCSVAKIMSDLSNNLPPTAAIPAGEWEICFRPAIIDKSGIILPGGPKGKPN
jgi:hypothetical protein